MATVIIIDFWRQRQQQIGETYDMAQAGIRRKVSDKAFVSFPGSNGLAQQSPKFRFAVSLEYSS